MARSSFAAVAVLSAFVASVGAIGSSSLVLAEPAPAIRIAVIDFQQEIRRNKEEHLESICERTFKETAAAMHLDHRAATDLLDRFYAIGARFSPGGRWRTRAVEERAVRRRWLLDIDASTRLFKEASTLETNPAALRKLAAEVESNAGIAEVLGSGRPDPCLREWVLSVLSQDASTVRRRVQQDAKLGSLCLSDYVKTDRRRMNSGDWLDTVPVWIWGPSNGRPSFGGPQTEPGRNPWKSE